MIQNRKTSLSSSAPSWLRLLGISCVIAFFGFLVRATVAIVWHNSIADGTHFRFGDSDTYWTIAEKIAQGLPYQYGSPDSRVFRAPLYPLFLSPWTCIDGSSEGNSWGAVLAARIAGCAIGATCIAMIVCFANKMICSPDQTTCLGCGVWAGILAVLYPGAIGMSVFILSEAIFCPIMLLSLGFTSFAIQSKNQGRWEIAWTWMLLSGALSGAACLARPSWSLWPAVLFAYLFSVVTRSTDGRSFNAGWKWSFGGLLFCAGIGMVMSPWWVRNYLETGKFVPTTLQVGASLYDGWHPGASGSSDEGMEFVNAFIVDQKSQDQRDILVRKKLESTLEWRLDRRLRNAAIGWALENSSDAARLGLVKFVKTWSPLPVARELGSNAVRWSEAIGYSAIMVFALIGMWQCRMQTGAWLYALPCVYFAMLHVFFIGSVRYRQPAVLAICVLGGVGCAAVARWICDKSSHQTKLDGSTTINDVTVDSPPN